MEFIVKNDRMFDQIENFLKVAGDNTRIRILYALLEKELCVCELQEEVGASQSLISHQLSVLRNGGFVKKRKQGKHCYYFLSDDHVSQLLHLVYDHVICEHIEEEKDDECQD